MESITVEEYETFLSEFGYDQAGDKRLVINLSFAFLSTLPFCEGVTEDETKIEVIAQAQSFIAYAMSEEGGGLNPAAVSDTRITVTEELGRDAIVDEFEVNSELIGADPVSFLKRVQIAYGLLRPLLCDGEQNGTSGIRNIDLIR